MIAHFVDRGGIVDHHCLNFLSIIHCALRLFLKDGGQNM